MNGRRWSCGGDGLVAVRFPADWVWSEWKIATQDGLCVCWFPGGWKLRVAGPVDMVAGCERRLRGMGWYRH